MRTQIIVTEANYAHKPNDRWHTNKMAFLTWLVNIAFQLFPLTERERWTPLIRIVPNKFPLHYILKRPISVLDKSGYVVKIFREKKRVNYLQTVETLIRRCGVWSGTALFANYHFSLQTTMGYSNKGPAMWENVPFVMCAQRGLKSPCASALSE